MSITPAIKRDYIANLAKNGKRADGRNFEDFRNIEIETGVYTEKQNTISPATFALCRTCGYFSLMK